MPNQKLQSEDSLKVSTFEKKQTFKAKYLTKYASNFASECQKQRS